MLNVLIVDDDVFIHSHLHKLIDWEGEGLHLCGGAANGSEAIRIIEENTPEIVITDMNMPGMDGVALIEYIQATYQRIKIIALSAYDDFNYVKQSLKLGAVDYLLKHTLTSETLLKILQAVKAAIIHEKQADTQHQRTAEQIQTGRSVLRQNFIRMLVREGIQDEETAKQRLDCLGLQLGVRNLVVVAGEIDGYMMLKEKFSASEIGDLLQQFVDMVGVILKDIEKSIISFIEDEKFVIIFSFEELYSHQSMISQVQIALNRVKATIKRYLNLTICLGFDGICKDITKINHYYQKSMYLMTKKFYEGKDRIFCNHAAGEIKHDQYILGIKEEKCILRLIDSLKSEELVQYIDDFFSRIQDRQPDPNYVKMVFITLINIADKTARDAGLDPRLLHEEINDPYEQLDKYETVQEAKDWFIGFYKKLIHLLESYLFSANSDEITKKVIEYIYHNYKNDLSLGDIADHIGINSSYLSRKFKKDCGKGVIEYLNFIRIEQAKKLMINGKRKVKEVAEDVGFNNYNYFFKVFKDSQGMTPLEYEKSDR